MKQTRIEDRLYYFFLYLFMAVVGFSMLYPFLFLLTSSFSSYSAIGLSLLPKEPTYSAYVKVIQNPNILNGFRNTVVRLFLGTSLTMAATVFTAYPLSKRSFPNRSLWTALLVFTMFFSGGLVPSYLLVRSLGIHNTVWALVLPGLISTYNMIIMRNFFMNIPLELEESARIDGAGDFSILFRIILPVSGPILATVLLWTMVGHWNAYFDSIIYITTGTKQVLQQVLRRVVLEGNLQMIMENPGLADAAGAGYENADAIKAATVITATIPIILVYPFLQKYFVKGILVGSLKG
jgi:putative aldouronate transport system permease protein